MSATNIDPNDLLDMSPDEITTILRSLERKGLVESLTRDNGEVAWRLTPKGKAAGYGRGWVRNRRVVQ